MAYPFGAPIAYAIFLKRLTDDHGCEIRVTTKPYRDPYNNEAVTFRYLWRRTDAGVTRIAWLPDSEPAVELMATVVRSLCARLDLDNTRFGVLSGIGSDPDPDDDDDD
jgi:hypothetical protein